MDIILNGKAGEAPDRITASELLELKGYKGKTSIWINGRQLLLSEYAATVIKDGDIIKLLRVVGGG